MSHLGQQIRLRGTSQRGQRICQRYGEIWTVLAETDKRLFASGLPGPWLFVVAAPDLDIHHASARWLHAESDPDFSFTSFTG